MEKVFHSPSRTDYMGVAFPDECVGEMHRRLKVNCDILEYSYSKSDIHIQCIVIYVSLV